MNYYFNFLRLKHKLIIDFFMKNGFGTSNPIKNYLSILSPIDRVVILEKLFSEGVRNMRLLDKMVLAYVKIDRVDLAKKIIDYARNSEEEEFNVWGLEQKLDVGIPPRRTDEERLLKIREELEEDEEYVELKEKEFLHLLIDFIKTPSVDKTSNEGKISINQKCRGKGMWRTVDELWEEWMKLNEGSLEENATHYILKSKEGKKYVANKSDDLVITNVYNRFLSVDLKNFEVFEGENPSGGYFILYRFRDEKRRKEFIMSSIGGMAQGSFFSFTIK